MYADFPVINGNGLSSPFLCAKTPTLTETHAVMSWFPDKNGYAPPRPHLKTFFARFELDPAAVDLTLRDPQNIAEMSGARFRLSARCVLPS